MIRLPRSRLVLSLASALLLVTLGGGVTVGAGPVAAWSVAPHTFPASSCIGFQACDGVTGTVGSNSCNGDHACQGAAGNVGHDSCDARGACAGAITGNIGNRSCDGDSACQYAAGNVGHDSCAGDFSCINAGPIGNYACNDGIETCGELSAVDDCAYNAPGYVPVPCFGTRSVMGSSAVPATAGQPVKLWATVFARYPVVGKPGGMFRFRIDGRTLPTDVAIDRYGLASVTRTFRPGVHWVSGRYLGDGTFAESTPVPMFQLVVK